MIEVFKPIAGYAATAALSWIAGRYHLSGDQMTAIAADLGTAATMVAGVALHMKALKTPVEGAKV